MMDFRSCRSRSVEVAIHYSLGLSWMASGQLRVGTTFEGRQISSVRRIQLQTVTGPAVGRCFR